MTVAANAVRRSAASEATSPRPSAASPGASGISVPISPTAGPARTSTRVRSSRRWAASSKSASACSYGAGRDAAGRVGSEVGRLGGLGDDARRERGQEPAAPPAPRQLDREAAELVAAGDEHDDDEHEDGDPERTGELVERVGEPPARQSRIRTGFRLRLRPEPYRGTQALGSGSGGPP